MEQNAIQVSVGGSFKVSLQSMLGSTNYGWVLTNLPEGIVLAGYEVTNVLGGIAPVNQIFHFGITNMKIEASILAQLTFQLACFSDFKKCDDEVTIDVVITNTTTDTYKRERKPIQYGKDYAIYNAQIPYGYPLATEPVLKYGVPCDRDLVEIKYGYPACTVQAIYGIPCEEPLLKYGAPCNKPVLKYGVPCESVSMRPTTRRVDVAAENDENSEGPVIVAYGTPCENGPVPCAVPGDEALVKYGAPCDEALVKYGTPCDSAE